MIAQAELTEEAIRQFAELARVPCEEVTAFGQCLGSLFDQVRNHVLDVRSREKRRAIAARLEKVSKAASKLLAELDQLDHSSRKTLGIYALWHEQFRPKSPHADDYGRFQIADLVAGGGTGQGLLKIAFHRKAIDDLRLAAATKEWPVPWGGGAPSNSFRLPGNPNVSAYDLFVVGLMRSILKFSGKLPTISESEAKGCGALVNLLRIASDYLPAGFVPKFVADADGKIEGLSRLKTLRDVAMGKDKSVPEYTHWWNQTGEKPTPKK